MKRIGLFGGTFNPIHFGHLRPAEEIAEQMLLEQVIFIPSAAPPHKKKQDILDAPLRLEMVRLAIADNARFALSAVEAERSGTSYSIETVEHLRRQFGPDKGELFFIVGLDAFLEIDTWKEYRALFSLCHFVVMTRPGFEKIFSSEHLPVELANEFCYDDRRKAFRHRSGFHVYPREITALDISSTRIRENLRDGRSVRYLVPDRVEEFIRAHGLYRTKDKPLAP
ncbi:MAG TPA: nicotinate-nucleotide adenylyltransferase [Thermodesulfobacteriota bacterium]|nr:nicotinate-nucleotide adenylyltransferase [Thermodesulfobacteriota bacterium]